VVATKLDALDDVERLNSLKERAEKDGKPFFAISSATNQGIAELVRAVGAKLDELRTSEKNTDTVELAL